MNVHGNGSGGGRLRRGLPCLMFAAALAAACAAPAWALPIGYLSDSNGQIAAWGRNTTGQCNVPAGAYSAISGGEDYSLAIRSDGTLAGWGDNYFGQCNVPAGTYSGVSAGWGHSLALRSNGTLAAWGCNWYGQCNFPAGTYLAVAAGEMHSVAISSNGTLVARGLNDVGQCNAPGGSYTTVDAGGNHSLALRPDGTVAAWGSNWLGMSNVPPGTYQAIAAGGRHSLVLRPDGTLVACGLNAYHQCDVPAGAFSAIDAGFCHNLALRPDGTLTAWGLNDDGQCNVPAGVFVAVAAGYYHSLALLARTDYDGDLLVSGTGVRANLNRSISVAGNASLTSTMYCYGSPTMTVAGTTTISPTGAIQGAATINGRVINEGLVNGELGLILNGPVSGSGNYAGRVTFNGGFSPGTSPASVTGDWIIFGPGNVLTMELGGIVQGTEYDHINANQLLTLGGTLDVQLINGFNPENHDTFDLLDGPMEGQFSALDLPAVDEGLMWFTDRLYSEGVISVGTPEPATLTLLALGGLTLLARRRRRG